MKGGEEIMKLYRLWLPQVGTHGSCFDKLCEKCQAKIGEAIERKLVLPTNPVIVVDDEVTILLGYSQLNFLAGTQVILCVDCAKVFKEWLDENDLHISNSPIELWVSNVEEGRLSNELACSPCTSSRSVATVCSDADYTWRNEGDKEMSREVEARGILKFLFAAMKREATRLEAKKR